MKNLFALIVTFCLTACSQAPTTSQKLGSIHQADSFTVTCSGPGQAIVRGDYGYYNPTGLSEWGYTVFPDHVCSTVNLTNQSLDGGAGGAIVACSDTCVIDPEIDWPQCQVTNSAGYIMSIDPINMSVYITDFTGVLSWTPHCTVD